MRIVKLILIGAVTLAAAGAAEAGWFGSKQPQAISPIYRARSSDGNRLSHVLREYKYNRPGWGGLWKQVYASHPNRLQPYIRGY